MNRDFNTGQPIQKNGNVDYHPMNVAKDLERRKKTPLPFSIFLKQLETRSSPEQYRIDKEDISISPRSNKKKRYKKKKQYDAINEDGGAETMLSLRSKRWVGHLFESPKNKSLLPGTQVTFLPPSLKEQRNGISAVENLDAELIELGNSHRNIFSDRSPSLSPARSTFSSSIYPKALQALKSTHKTPNSVISSANHSYYAASEKNSAVKRALSANCNVPSAGRTRIARQENVSLFSSSHQPKITSDKIIPSRKTFAYQESILGFSRTKRSKDLFESFQTNKSPSKKSNTQISDTKKKFQTTDNLSLLFSKHRIFQNVNAAINDSCEKENKKLLNFSAEKNVSLLHNRPQDNHNIMGDDILFCPKGIFSPLNSEEYTIDQIADHTFVAYSTTSESEIASPPATKFAAETNPFFQYSLLDHFQNQSATFISFNPIEQQNDVIKLFGDNNLSTVDAAHMPQSRSDIVVGSNFKVIECTNDVSPTNLISSSDNKTIEGGNGVLNSETFNRQQLLSKDFCSISLNIDNILSEADSKQNKSITGNKLSEMLRPINSQVLILPEELEKRVVNVEIEDQNKNLSSTTMADLKNLDNQVFLSRSKGTILSLNSIDDSLNVHPIWKDKKLNSVLNEEGIDMESVERSLLSRENEETVFQTNISHETVNEKIPLSPPLHRFAEFSKACLVDDKQESSNVFTTPSYINSNMTNAIAKESLPLHDTSIPFSHFVTKDIASLNNYNAALIKQTNSQCNGIKECKYNAQSQRTISVYPPSVIYSAGFFPAHPSVNEILHDTHHSEPAFYSLPNSSPEYSTLPPPITSFKFSYPLEDIPPLSINGVDDTQLFHSDSGMKSFFPHLNNTKRTNNELCEFKGYAVANIDLNAGASVSSSVLYNKEEINIIGEPVSEGAPVEHHLFRVNCSDKIEVSVGAFREETQPCNNAGNILNNEEFSVLCRKQPKQLQNGLNFLIPMDIGPLPFANQIVSSIEKGKKPILNEWSSLSSSENGSAFGLTICEKENVKLSSQTSSISVNSQSSSSQTLSQGSLGERINILEDESDKNSVQSSCLSQSNTKSYTYESEMQGKPEEKCNDVQKVPRSISDLNAWNFSQAKETLQENTLEHIANSDLLREKASCWEKKSVSQNAVVHTEFGASSDDSICDSFNKAQSHTLNATESSKEYFQALSYGKESGISLHNEARVDSYCEKEDDTEETHPPFFFDCKIPVMGNDTQKPTWENKGSNECNAQTSYVHLSPSDHRIILESEHEMLSNISPAQDKGTQESSTDNQITYDEDRLLKDVCSNETVDIIIRDESIEVVKREGCLDDINTSLSIVKDNGNSLQGKNIKEVIHLESVYPVCDGKDLSGIFLDTNLCELPSQNSSDNTFVADFSGFNALSSSVANFVNPYFGNYELPQDDYKLMCDQELQPKECNSIPDVEVARLVGPLNSSLNAWMMRSVDQEFPISQPKPAQEKNRPTVSTNTVDVIPSLLLATPNSLELSAPLTLHSTFGKSDRVEDNITSDIGTPLDDNKLLSLDKKHVLITDQKTPLNLYSQGERTASILLSNERSVPESVLVDTNLLFNVSLLQSENFINMEEDHSRADTLSEHAGIIHTPYKTYSSWKSIINSNYSITDGEKHELKQKQSENKALQSSSLGEQSMQMAQLSQGEPSKEGIKKRVSKGYSISSLFSIGKKGKKSDTSNALKARKSEAVTPSFQSNNRDANISSKIYHPPSNATVILKNGSSQAEEISVSHSGFLSSSIKVASNSIEEDNFAGRHNRESIPIRGSKKVAGMSHSSQPESQSIQDTPYNLDLIVQLITEDIVDAQHLTPLSIKEITTKVRFYCNNINEVELLKIANHVHNILYS